MRTERIYRQRKRRNLAIHYWLLDLQRFATVRLFHFAIGQFRDFQLGRQRLGNPPQFTGGLELCEKITKRIERHAGRVTKRSGCAIRSGVWKLITVGRPGEPLEHLALSCRRLAGTLAHC